MYLNILRAVNGTTKKEKEMRSVAICGSRRFREGIRKFAKGLKEKGVVIYEPILFESKDDSSISLSEDVKYLRRCGVTFHHLAQIKKADVCFFYNKGGYMGYSTSVELGAAAALDKPIYALEEDTDDPPRGILIDEVIPTVQVLIERLK